MNKHFKTHEAYVTYIHQAHQSLLAFGTLNSTSALCLGADLTAESPTESGEIWH